MTLRRLVLVLGLCRLFFLTATLLAQDVRITEFLASNPGGLLDEDGDASDWLELQNFEANAVNLEGWFLTDDRANLTLWRFPSTPLGAGARIVVFASGKNR